MMNTKSNPRLPGRKPGPLGRIKQYFRPFTSMGDISGGVERIRPVAETQPEQGVGLQDDILRRRSQFGQPRKQPVTDTKKQEKVIKAPKPLGKVKTAIVIVLVLLCLGTVGYTARVIFAKDSGAQVNSGLDQYYGILTKEEQNEWETKVQQKGKAYVQMNTRVQMGLDGKAHIRLINPPYSNYDQNVVIYIKELDKDVFQSGMMHPGTVLEYTDIPGLEEGLYNATARFAFYNLEGVEKGSYNLEFTFEVEDAKGIEDAEMENLSLDVPIIEQENDEALPNMETPGLQQTDSLPPTDADAPADSQTPPAPSFADEADTSPPADTSGPSFAD